MSNISKLFSHMNNWLCLTFSKYKVVISVGDSNIVLHFRWLNPFSSCALTVHFTLQGRSVDR